MSLFSATVLCLPELMSTGLFYHSSFKATKRSLFGSSDLSPVSASSYFTQALQIDPQDHACSFRAYYTPSVAKATAQPDLKGKKASVLVCHHGAGSSGTTFAALAKEVQDKSAGELGVLAFDARGHGTLRFTTIRDRMLSNVLASGKTITRGGAKELELSFANLQQDFLAMIKEMFPEPSESPDLVVSQSDLLFSNASASLTAIPRSCWAIPWELLRLLRLPRSCRSSVTRSSASLSWMSLKVRLRIVTGRWPFSAQVACIYSGTAVEALPLMRSILSQRPSKFRSVEGAIDWQYVTGAKVHFSLVLTEFGISQSHIRRSSQQRVCSGFCTKSSRPDARTS